MAYTTIADDTRALHHPKTWVGKYVWSQDHKVIALQYSVTAISIGVVALVLSDLMRLQLGFPDAFKFITPSAYLQFLPMPAMLTLFHFFPPLRLSVFPTSPIPLL